MLKINYNNSYKKHIYLGIVIAFWLIFFLVFISPFDLTELSLIDKLCLIPPYGIFLFISYMITIYLQRFITNKWKKWNIIHELSLIGLVCLINLVLTYSYYITPFINGELSILSFISIVYIPITILICSLLFFGRIFISRKESQVNLESKQKVALMGENKNDILYVEPDNIISISSAQNYVEVFYMQNQKIEKHLIRGTLKRVASELEFLVQTHRSHLINPHYIIKWIDNKTLLVGERSIPISKTYKSSLITLIHSIPNKSHLVPKAQ